MAVKSPSYKKLNAGIRKTQPMVKAIKKYLDFSFTEHFNMTFFPLQKLRDENIWIGFRLSLYKVKCILKCYLLTDITISSVRCDN